MTDVENKWDAGLGVKISNVSEDGNSWTSTVSTEKVISTSAEPEYVGANGDLFIGSSNNLIYGLARNLTLRRDGSDVTLGVKDAYTTGLQFKTEFAYSANYIENVLIPNLISLRNSKAYLCCQRQRLQAEWRQRGLSHYAQARGHWLWYEQ